MFFSLVKFHDELCNLLLNRLFSACLKLLLLCRLEHHRELFLAAHLNQTLHLGLGHFSCLDLDHLVRVVLALRKFLERLVHLVGVFDIDELVFDRLCVLIENLLF